MQIAKVRYSQGPQLCQRLLRQNAKLDRLLILILLLYLLMHLHILNLINATLFIISLPNYSSIHRLQLVQNALARVVVPSTLRHHHITPVLKGLHWLPVEQRIKYKIASITYKTLHNQIPSYLYELLSPVAQSGRRSSSNKLLNLQRVNTISGLRSFFSAAPRIWNYLPTALRLSPTYSLFRSKLKNLLFSP